MPLGPDRKHRWMDGVSGGGGGGGGVLIDHPTAGCRARGPIPLVIRRSAVPISGGWWRLASDWTPLEAVSKLFEATGSKATIPWQFQN